MLKYLFVEHGLGCAGEQIILLSTPELGTSGEIMTNAREGKTGDGGAAGDQ